MQTPDDGQRQDDHDQVGADVGDAHPAVNGQEIDAVPVRNRLVPVVRKRCAVRPGHDDKYNVAENDNAGGGISRITVEFGREDPQVQAQDGELGEG